MEACDDGARERLQDLRQKFLLSNANKRAKFLPANRTRPFLEWFDAGKVSTENESILPTE